MKIRSICKNNLTKSGKSPAEVAKSNKQWVGTCLYQEEENGYICKGNRGRIKAEAHPFLGESEG